MKILINTSSTFKGGGVQVATSFINECKKITKNIYFVVLGKAVSKSINIYDFPNNFTFLEAPFRPATRFFKFSSHNKFLKDAENEFKPDVVFTTSGPSYWRPKAPHLSGYNIPHYVYPESPYFDIISLKKKLWWFGMKRLAYLNFKYSADSFAVQTDDVKERLKKFINNDNVFTVSNTISSNYINPIKTTSKIPISEDHTFKLLTLSAWYPHKNLEIIGKVIEVLRSKNINTIRFVLTVDKVRFKNSSLSGYNEIINIGSVKINEAPSLYNECDAMFLPTLLECFSASYVEAMQMKKPILTSDLGFSHTICKDAAIYFNPMDAEDIATKIIELANSGDLKKQLIKKGELRLLKFGDATMRAEKYLQLCEQLISK